MIPPIEGSADTSRRPQIRTHPSHRFSLDLDGPNLPEGSPGHALIHSENGTGMTACSPNPEGSVSYTVNRTMITNNAQSANANGHISRPSHRLSANLCRTGHDRPRAVTTQISSDPF
jgi:hypothetical protein